ncbi:MULTISPECIES: hypothetical protein [Burkholderia cepacia complex]|uniref:Uncharacterized protein n=1 Tax=Burkholderia cenocepacia TaxID=95486 RepID=A0ABD4UCE9_9BURK|nr:MULTISPECIES: hypothetical protein [Burkholderia cepacia complex]MCW3696337.1 hypothetical protein [Burkholderia cenocepacia]MCW3704444.1 hypothetical protein [Burkholderia cenocepacia]MCW3712117.1 hypothetical protein [Burkholderia cenocepacia]MCW3720116.1 hypothetical protein [Burkholderia cenocepacia]MCW3727820.1 hypothetical protein [Burkholderia cenocepacia]
MSRLLLALVGTAYKNEMTEKKWSREFGHAFQSPIVKYVDNIISETKFKANAQIVDRKLQEYLDNTPESERKISVMREIASKNYI